MLTQLRTIKGRRFFATMIRPMSDDTAIVYMPRVPCATLAFARTRECYKISNEKLLIPEEIPATLL